MDKLASTVRVMFFDFSSAFNTIRLALLGDKLTVMQVNPTFVSWIVNYLTDRPQYVCSQTASRQFSDDSAAVRCISKGEEEECRDVVDNFVTWCEQSHLQLNVAKTREQIVDLRRAKAPVTPVSIQGHSANIVRV